MIEIDSVNWEWTEWDWGQVRLRMNWDWNGDMRQTWWIASGLVDWQWIIQIENGLVVLDELRLNWLDYTR